MDLEAAHGKRHTVRVNSVLNCYERPEIDYKTFTSSSRGRH